MQESCERTKISDIFSSLASKPSVKVRQVVIIAKNNSSIFDTPFLDEREPERKLSLVKNLPAKNKSQLF